MFWKRLQVGQDVSGDNPLQAEWRTNATNAAGSDSTEKTQCLVVRLYNGTGSALVAGRPYAVEATGAEATQWQVITPAALAVYQHVVIALEATAAASFGPFAVQGFCDALVESTTDIADLDYLDVTPGTSAVAMIKDHSTVRSTASVARACEARTDNDVGMIRVQLLGDRVILP
jgi:hypothetical protein